MEITLSFLEGTSILLHGWDWTTKSLKPNSPYASVHYKFGESLDDNGLTQVIEEPPRLENTLDLLINNKPSKPD